MPTPEPLPPIPGTIAFIGGGNMARSLIGGLLARGMPAAGIIVSEPQAQARDALARDFGIRTTADNNEAVRGAALVMLAVKPQVMRAVCENVRDAIGDALVVSIAAGVGCTQIDSWLGGGRAIVRCMPNTPALLGAGASGLFANPNTSAAQRESAERVMRAAGIAVWIEDEALMDAVTAVSGSGPAYVFLLAEAMQAAGIAQGLPPDAARALVVQTVLGAGRMLAESDEPAAALRQRVTSPGGTTQAAIESFEADGLRDTVSRAISAATRRGVELSRQSGL